MKPITTKDKALICFAVDMSCSLHEKIIYDGKLLPKSEVVSQIVNLSVTEYINFCNRGGEYKDYFDIMIFGYYGTNVISLLEGLTPSNRNYATICELVNSKTEKVNYGGTVLINGADSTYNRVAYNLVKISPSDATPMYGALRAIKLDIEKWIKERKNSYSMILATNISDGDATDANSCELLKTSNDIKQISKNLIFSNIHIGKNDSNDNKSVIFPSSIDKVKGRGNAELMFEMSSELSPEMSDIICRSLNIHYDGETPLRAMSYNASLDRLATILQIGTLTIDQII